MLLSVALVMGFLCQSAVSYRVIGWKQDYYTEDSKHHLGIGNNFGDINGGGTWITWGAWGCWGYGRNAYCYLRLKMTSTSGARHFQIKGTESISYDMSHKYVCGSPGGTGDRSGKKHRLASGRAWNGCTNGWGITTLGAFGEWTTERPLISAFSNQKVKADRRWVKQPEHVSGIKSNGYVEVKVAEFQCWSPHWWWTCLEFLRYYEPPTKLIKFEAQLDKKRVSQVSDVVAKYRVIKNDGCGTHYEAGMTGSETDRVEVSVSTTVGWSKSFGFSFEVSSTVGGDIGAVSAEVTMTAGFSYEQSSDFSREQSRTTSKEYSWPTYCAPGFECRTDILRKSEEVILPTIFTFKRGEETFTEENDMKTKLQSTHENTIHKKIERKSHCKRSLR